jgi:two-component system sensor histidine kinase UhpB
VIEEESMTRILVVEDSATQAAEIAFVLEDAGFEVDIAGDGVQAIRRMEESPADLVLADVLMPGMSGFELCRTLRQRPQTSEVPVVLLTTLDSAADILRGLECGADGYLNKPCAPEILVARIRECMAARLRDEASGSAADVEVPFRGQSYLFPRDPRQILGYLVPALAYLARKRGEADEQETRGKQALRRSEERFALAASGANDGLWDWDLVSNQLYVSPRCREIAEVPHDDASTDPEVWLERVHPDDIAELRDNTRAHLKGHTAHLQNEHRLQTPGGIYRWVLLRGCCVRNGNGRPYRMAGSLTDITEQKRAQEEVLASREDLQLLARRLYAIIEDERTMTAHDLHRKIGQQLASAQGPLARLLRKLPPDQKDLHESARQVTASLDTAMRNLIEMATELRSPVAGAHGLAAGVRSYVVAFQRRTGIGCRLTPPPADLTLDLPRASTLFRILQEALASVANHGRSTKAEVRLTVEAGNLVLEVMDNGTETEPPAAGVSQSLDVLGMCERARQWGGDVTVAAEPGQGTVLTARIPLADQNMLG